MSHDNSIKSVEYISEDNIFTSQTTQNKSQKLSNLKTESKDINNLSNHNSEDEELLRNKLLISANEIEFPSNQKINSNEMNTTSKKGSLALSLSPIKKGIKRRNILVDIMEKSKKNNVPKRGSVIIQAHESKLKDEIIKMKEKMFMVYLLIEEIKKK